MSLRTKVALGAVGLIAFCGASGCNAGGVTGPGGCGTTPVPPLGPVIATGSPGQGRDVNGGYYAPIYPANGQPFKFKAYEKYRIVIPCEQYHNTFYTRALPVNADPYSRVGVNDRIALLSSRAREGYKETWEDLILFPQDYGLSESEFANVGSFEAISGSNVFDKPIMRWDGTTPQQSNQRVDITRMDKDQALVQAEQRIELARRHLNQARGSEQERIARADLAEAEGGLQALYLQNKKELEVRLARYQTERQRQLYWARAPRFDFVNPAVEEGWRRPRG